MKKRKKSKKRKIFIVVFFLLFLILLLISMYVINNDLLEYRTKLTIEVGDNVPSVDDYIYDNKEEIKDIKWYNLETIDGKIYKIGTYTGVFNYKNEDKMLALNM